MTDLLDRIADEMRARVKELEPAVEEHSRLTEALGAFETPAPKVSNGAPKKAARRPRKAAKTRSRRGGRPTGQNRQRILDLLTDRPGLTYAEIEEALGMTRTNLHQTMSRMAKSGDVVGTEGTDGKQWAAVREQVQETPMESEPLAA